MRGDGDGATAAAVAAVAAKKQHWGSAAARHPRGCTHADEHRTHTRRARTGETDALALGDTLAEAEPDGVTEPLPVAVLVAVAVAVRVTVAVDVCGWAGEEGGRHWNAGGESW